MDKLRQAAEQALEALRNAEVVHMEQLNAMYALQEALAQQEPVKFKVTVIDDEHPDGVPLENWGKPAQQEPFCYHDGRNIVGKEFADHSDVFPLYTAPPQHEWQGLTDDEYETMAEDYVTNCYFNTLKYARAIEAKLKDRNS